MIKHGNRHFLWALLPLLVFYLVVCAICAEDSVISDEVRYLSYARNICHGFYAPKNLMLWNGPGYPLLLTPFAITDVPIILAKFLNAFLLFGAVCFTNSILRQYMSARRSLLGSYALGLYAPFLPYMTLLLTESLAIFLAAGFSYFLARYVRGGRARYVWTAGFFLAYLILTRVMFAYVAAFGLLISIAAAKWSPTSRKTALVYAISLLFCVPYLVYTYNLTGKIFYWGNSGGRQLYWMTSPYAEEYGDWASTKRVLTDELWQRHYNLHEELAELDFVEKDALLKKHALQNIREYPEKYLANWIANLGRMWFEYPISYKIQRPHTLFFMVFNSFLLASMILCLYPLWKSRKLLPGELWGLSLFALIYLGGSSLVSTYTRLIQPVVPILVIMIFYAANVVLDIKLRRPTEAPLE